MARRSRWRRLCPRLSGRRSRGPRQLWRHSVQPGGSPATSDSVPPGGSDILAYTLASPVSFDAGTAALSCTRRAGADATRVTHTGSTDLATWNTAGITLVSTRPDPRGNEVLTYSLTPAGRRYFRAEVIARRAVAASSDC